MTEQLLPKVHIHTAGEKAFFTNAYLVEGEAGVIAVDAPFTVSEARAFRAKLEGLNKPLLAVLVTHAHADHYNGLTELLAGNTHIPVVALDKVEAGIRAIDGHEREMWEHIYKDDYPKTTLLPTRLLKDGEAVTFGGMTFRVFDAGPGESEVESVWVVESTPRVVFIGDLVFHQMHGWLAEGRTGAWLHSLKKAAQWVEGARVYPGHGPAGGPELLAWQEEYLRTYRAAVREVAGGRPSLDEAGKKLLAERLEKALPKARLFMAVLRSADPVAAELAAEDPGAVQ